MNPHTISPHPFLPSVCIPKNISANSPLATVILINRDSPLAAVVLINRDSPLVAVVLINRDPPLQQ